MTKLKERKLFVVLFLFAALMPEFTGWKREHFMRARLSAFALRSKEVQERPIRISSKELYERKQKREKVLLLDVREKNEFEEEHIPGALHFPKSQFDRKDPALMEILEKTPKDEMVVTYCGAGHRSGWVAISLRKMGFKHVWNLDGISFWKRYRFPLVTGVIVKGEEEPLRIGTEEAWYMYRSFTDVLFVDVRDVKEFEEGHIEGAVSIPLTELEGRLAEIPQDKDKVFYCSGTDGEGLCSSSLSAARILIHKGFPFGKIKVYEGGFGAWKSLGLPITLGDRGS